MGICKFCGSDTKLIKAHIVPKCLYKDLICDEKGYLYIVSTGDEKKKRSRVGIYDKNILCSGCEKIFQQYDDYGCNFFNGLNLKNLKRIESDGEVISYVVDKYNYIFLKIFIVSVLLRASFSKMEFYSLINLGDRYTSIAKEMILNNDPKGEEDFSILIKRFDDENYCSIMPHPHHVRYHDVFYYRMYFGSCIIEIKVDKRKIPEQFKGIGLSQKPPFYLIMRSWETSDERRRAVEAAKSSW